MASVTSLITKFQVRYPISRQVPDAPNFNLPISRNGTRWAIPNPLHVETNYHALCDVINHQISGTVSDDPSGTRCPKF